MEKELLFSLTKKDFTIQTFRFGGKGGQNQNKVETGVRIIHSASGAIGESREYRTLGQNKKAAFLRLTQTKKFKLWHKIKCAEMMGAEPIEKIVERLMIHENIKIETQNEKGEWIII